MIKIIKYGADWCAPCKATSSNLAKSGIQYEEIDIDKNPEITKEKGIKSIPYLEFYLDNDTIPYATHKGLMTLEEITDVASRTK